MYGYPLIPTFDRPGIKARAKTRLSEYYWLAFAVSLLTGVIAGDGGVGLNFNFNANSNIGSRIEQAMQELLSHPLIAVILAVAGMALVLGLVASLAMSFFLYGPVRVGAATFFLNLSKGEPKFKDIIHGFSSGISGAYLNVCKVMFLRSLYLFFWQLLFLIPFAILFVGGFLGTQTGMVALLGVVMALFAVVLMVPASIPFIAKSYEYAMIPYLLSEYPDMSPKNAFAASRHLTQGHKWDLFVLDISFFGWILLGVLCCGIGVLFVAPYYDAAMAEAYAQLCRLKAPPTPSVASEPGVDEQEEVE